MNKQRFLSLLKAHLENRSTEEESDELIALARTGKYDELLKEQIDGQLAQEENARDMPPSRAQMILQEILLTEENVVPLRKKRTTWWAAAAAIALLAVAGYLVIDNQEQEPTHRIAEYERVSEPGFYSGKRFVRLPDGSTVVMNENSTLSYAANFGQKDRVVTLLGEGYFDIRRDESKPFKVNSGKVTTTVLGTAFNIKAYPGQDDILVSVTRGMVRVEESSGQNPESNSQVLTADQEVSFNTSTLAFTRTDRPVENATDWKKSYLIFDDLTLAEAIDIIEKRYQVHVQVSSSKLLKCTFTATFLNEETLDQVLTVISATLSSTYTRTGDEILLEGPGCE